MNMQPPLQRTANQLSDYGRFGDSTLVHMNPAEVSGLAAMSPTGELTINPVTGQPEAFLPFLAPIFGSLMGGAALGGTWLGTAGASALGAGLATWAESGDFEKGLISGVTGFGLGQILGAAGHAGAEAATLGPEALGVAQAEAALATAGEAVPVGQIPTSAMLEAGTTEIAPLSYDVFDPTNVRFQEAAAFSPAQQGYADA